MKIRFYLRKMTQTFCVYFEFRNSAGTIRLRTSTGFVVKSKKDWDSKKERLKIPSSVYGTSEINDKLMEGLYNFKKAMKSIDENNASETEIKNLMLQVFDKLPLEKRKVEQKNKAKTNLIDYYNWFLNYYATNNSPYSRRPLSKASLKTYKTGLSRLEEYISERGLKKFSFNDCNRVFYDDFISFLTGRNYSNNYIGTIIQKLKTVLNSSYDEGIHNNAEFKKVILQN